MKTTNFLVCLTGVAQVVQSLEAPIDGYDVADFEWEVQIGPDAALHHINGTVQDVVQYLKEVDPTYKLPEIHVEEPERRQGTLESRQLYIDCFTWPEADGHSIEEGISYLRYVDGKPSNGPGPGACGRVSCSYDSAIWWCNDNSFAYTLPSFRNVADGANNVYQKCWRRTAPSTYKTSGQGFFDGHWNVIVRGDSC